MIDAIKKTLLAGVGAAIVTKDKVEASLGDFVEQGKVTAEEARAMAEQIASDGRQEFEMVSAKLSEKMDSFMTASNGPTQARLRTLEARLRKLEAALARTGSRAPKARTAKRTTRSSKKRSG